MTITDEELKELVEKADEINRARIEEIKRNVSVDGDVITLHHNDHEHEDDEKSSVHCKFRKASFTIEYKRCKTCDLRAHELAMYMVKVGTANIEKAVNKKISKPDTGLLYS